MDIVSIKNIKSKNDFTSIEVLKNLDDIKNNVKYQSDNFSLEAMYKYDPYSFCDGAAIIVTKDKFYGCYLSSDRDPSGKIQFGHWQVFVKMDLLLMDIDEISRRIASDDLMDPENVYMELSTDSYSCVMIPSKISKFQFDIINELSNFYKEKKKENIKAKYKNIDGKSKEVGDVFDAYISLDDKSDSVFLTDNIDKIKRRIVNEKGISL